MITVAGLSAIAPSVGAADVHAPVGGFDGITARFDNPTLEVNTPEVLHLSGWAADEDEPGHPVEVDVYEGSTAVAIVGTGSARPDVARVAPWAGPNAGWQATIPLQAHPQSSRLCAYAIGIPVGGANTLLGCRDLSAPSPKDPIGNFDGAYSAPGQIHLIGWAGDPDGRATTLLRIYYDGPYPSLLSTPVLEPTASLPRPDVRAAYPKLSATTGFDLTLPITPGVHTICIKGENTGPSGTHNLDLGCVHGTIPDSPPPGPHDPRGGFDGIRPGSSSCGPTCGWNASGWAYDPDTGGPVAVRVRSIATTDIDERTWPGRTRANAVRLTTGVARPDVQAAVPAAGPNAGFKGFAIIGGTGSIRVACAWALNVGPGHDRLLGCTEDR
jgi:hypothetical protein